MQEKVAVGENFAVRHHLAVDRELQLRPGSDQRGIDETSQFG
jgi:hypothetical protein